MPFYVIYLKCKFIVNMVDHQNLGHLNRKTRNEEIKVTQKVIKTKVKYYFI